MVLRIGAYPNRHSEKHNVRVPRYRSSLTELEKVSFPIAHLYNSDINVGGLCHKCC